MEGEEREVRIVKSKRENKQKMTKKNRDLGLGTCQHFNQKSRSMGIRCDSQKCATLFKRECQKVSDDVSHQIFRGY